VSEKKGIHYTIGGVDQTGKILRLVDSAALLPSIDMVEQGNGMYLATNVPSGRWKVYDITSGAPGTDTGFRMDVDPFSASQEELPTSDASKFFDGTHVFRNIEIADVQGLQAAMDEAADALDAAVATEQSARNDAIASEATARTSGDAALDARLDVLEARNGASIPTSITFENESGGSVSALSPSIARIVKFNGGFRIIGMVWPPSAVSSWAGNVLVRISSATPLGISVPSRPPSTMVQPGYWQASPSVNESISGHTWIDQIASATIRFYLIGKKWEDVTAQYLFLHPYFRFVIDVLED